MAAPRGRASASRGLLRAFGRLVLLVAIGFGAGLLIGVVSEEPELLAGHLRGESEDVVLAAPTAQLDRQEVETARPTSDVPETLELEAEGTRSEALADAEAPVEWEPVPLEETAPGVAPASAPAPAPAPRRVAAQPEEDANAALPAVASRRPSEAERRGEAAEAWSIQVGAFSEEASAGRLVESLRAKGYPVELVPAEGAAGRWRVRVQPVRGESEAREMANRLKRDERLPTWVLPMERRSES